MATAKQNVDNWIKSLVLSNDDVQHLHYMISHNFCIKTEDADKDDDLNMLVEGMIELIKAIRSVIQNGNYDVLAFFRDTIKPVNILQSLLFINVPAGLPTTLIWHVNIHGQVTHSFSLPGIKVFDDWKNFPNPNEFAPVDKIDAEILYKFICSSFTNEPTACFNRLYWITDHTPRRTFIIVHLGKEILDFHFEMPNSTSGGCYINADRFKAMTFAPSSPSPSPPIQTFPSQNPAPM
jgi:hypothetical protein